MHKIRVNLVTKSDMEEFVHIAQSIPDEVYLQDNHKHCVNAKSMLGCLYSVEFDETYVTSDNPCIASKFNKFTE